MGKRDAILQLLKEGKSTAEVVDILGIPRSTVRYHKSTKRRERCKRNSRLRAKRLKSKAVAYSGGKCLRCGYDICVEALDFHHLDPNEKEYGIGSLTSHHKLAWELLKLEIDKTLLICRNCHSELHAEMWQPSQKMIELQLELRNNYLDLPLAAYDNECD